MQSFDRLTQLIFSLSLLTCGVIARVCSWYAFFARIVILFNALCAGEMILFVIADRAAKSVYKNVQCCCCSTWCRHSRQVAGMYVDAEQILHYVHQTRLPASDNTRQLLTAGDLQCNIARSIMLLLHSLPAPAARVTVDPSLWTGLTLR